MFTGLLARDNYHKLRDLSPLHPFLQLRHDLLDVRFDLVIGRNCYEVRAIDVDLEEHSSRTQHIEAIFFNPISNKLAAL